MLFTLGLLLLLTPLPSFQTTTNEKRDARGSNVTKANTVLTPLKPKTTATPFKLSEHPTLKPNTVNRTVLPTPAFNQKPPNANPATATKSRLSLAANQTTLSAAVKPTTTTSTIVNKDKQKVNQTVHDKFTSLSEFKANEVRPAPTRAPNVQPTFTKLPPTRKITKDKPRPSGNHTSSVKPSTSGASNLKDKSARAALSTAAKIVSAIGEKTSKNKMTVSVNQFVTDHPRNDENSKDRPVPTKVPDHHHSSDEKTKEKPTLTKVPDQHQSSDEKTKDKPPSTKAADLPHSSDEKSKDKPFPTKATDLPHSSDEKSKDKPVPTKVPDHPHRSDEKTKDKPVPTKVADLPHRSDVKSKDKPVPTKIADITHRSDEKSRDKPVPTKVADLTHRSDEKTKDKPIPTKVPDHPHSSDEKSKDKPATTKVTDLPHSGDEKSKDKSATTKVANLPHSGDKSKDKPATTKVLSTPAKGNRTDGSATDKDKVPVSTNHTSSTPSTLSKEKLNKPIKVVISNDCNSNQSKGEEVTLKPGAPLVMTHKISLLPGGCTGECEAEMATLKGRVAKLERQMSLLIEKCPCSANCPNDCSGNGKCEKGKCLCHQGFMGPDCTSKCAQGDCSKKAKETLKTATEPVNKGKENVTKEETKGKKTGPEDKDKKTGPEDKDIATKVASNAKEGAVKTHKKSQEVSDEKSSKNDGGSQEVRQEKTETKVFPTVDPNLDKKKTKINPKSDHLKDEPHSNVTRGNKLKKKNETTKTETNLTVAGGTKKDPPKKESPGKFTLTGKNDTRPTGNEHKKEGSKKLSTDNRKMDGKTDKEKEAHPSQDPTIKTTTEKTKVLENSGSSTRGTGGLGSVRVENISSHSFTITWLAPKGMFKNFTLIRKEPLTESDKDELEGLGVEASEKDIASAGWNSTDVHSESTNSTVSSSQTKRISVVIPGSVRSVEFSNLRADTRYALQIYGSTADRRSKIHRVTATTGPEPPTELVFSNVTEYALAVSWTKPNTMVTGFQITYINKATGKSRFVTVSSKQTQVVLSELSAGSSYIISVTSTKGRAQSDKLTSVITTVPAPPTHLQVNNVTDTRAVLQWTPSLGKVDSFIISYESSKTPNVTVTVMLSGNSVQYELKGLQRGILYKIKVLSQKDSLKSVAISTTLTTANVIKASEVGARSAVIVWKTPAVYQSYRIIYQVEGEVAKEVILEPTFTEYKLTGLLPLSRYTVLVQGEKNGLYTSIVTSQFITGKLRFPFPTECSQELLNGALESGEVDIYPQGKEGRAVRVYCDMETDGGGWTVFQRRMNGKTDFYRNWSDYKVGFGNLSDEFWLGNEFLHNLTSMGPVSLRVDLKSGNDTAYAHYTNFSIASEERNYTLTVSGYTGTAGDSMKYHNGRPFSARDKKPDPLGIHCSRAYMGGWWYKNCYKANLNGLYGINSNNQGVVWIDWKGKDSSIPFTEMKFRPSRFSPATHG